MLLAFHISIYYPIEVLPPQQKILYETLTIKATSLGLREAIHGSKSLCMPAGKELDTANLQR